MIYSERYTKIVLSFFIVSVTLMAILFNYMDNRATKESLNFQFNGKVDSVTYNIKGKATVLINGVEYPIFDPNWNFDHTRIMKGDSIVKRENSMIIKLFRNDTLVTTQGKDN